MPYDQTALYGPSASTSWACNRAIKCSLRSCCNCTCTHWDLTHDYIVDHCGACFIRTLGEVQFGHQCRQKDCFNIYIPFIILLGQLRDHLLNAVALPLYPARCLQPAGWLAGMELGAVWSAGGVLTFGTYPQALAQLTLKAFLEGSDLGSLGLFIFFYLELVKDVIYISGSLRKFVEESFLFGCAFIYFDICLKYIPTRYFSYIC